jgi:internalin A
MNKPVYFHPKLKQDFNVGYLMGLFESKEQTIDKYKSGEIKLTREEFPKHSVRENIPPFVLQILQNNSQEVKINNQIQIEINIDIQAVYEISNSVQGDASYLIEELKASNAELTNALQKVIEFTNDTGAAQNTGEVKKKIVEVLKTAKDHVKDIDEGKESIKSILLGLKDLAGKFDFQAIAELIQRS